MNKNEKSTRIPDSQMLLSDDELESVSGGVRGVSECEWDSQG